MRCVRLFFLSSITFLTMWLLTGCDDTIHGCDPSTDYCSCQKNYDDCHEAECWEEDEECKGNINCTRLANCIEACKTEECPECYEMFGDGEKDLDALEKCDRLNCGLCPR